jgi:CRP-like cAMP-binding protein
VLVRRGERADTAYVVLDGNVRLEASGALLGEGDLVGGAEAARGVAWAGAVVAEGGASLLRIDPGLWTSTLPAHTEVRSLFEAVERERVLEGHRCTAPWFTGLRGGQRRALLARFEARRFRAGERILRAGVPALGFFVVTGGEVRVERGGAELARLRPAAHFGEISVLQGIPATADVVAQDDVECLVLSPNAFHAAMAFHPDQVDALAAVARARHATTALRVA